MQLATNNGLTNTRALGLLYLVCWSASWTTSAGGVTTYFYTGPSSGNFFDEANWTTAPDGSGASPADGDLDPGVALVDVYTIDGDAVKAAGSLVVGAQGVVDLREDSSLAIESPSASSTVIFEPGASLVANDSRLTVEGDVVLGGHAHWRFGRMESLAGNVRLMSSNLTFVGAELHAGDNLIVAAPIAPDAGAVVADSQLTVANRLGLHGFELEAHNTLITVGAGMGDVEDVSGIGGSGATLMLTGNSQLHADQVQEGVQVVLEDHAVATLTNAPDNDEPTWITEEASVTVNSPTAQLVLLNDQWAPVDGRIFHGTSGLSYDVDATSWSVAGWNGMTAATLTILAVETNSDFDGDQRVAGSDLVIWQRGFGQAGQTNNSRGDSNHDGLVDALDLADWQSDFGLPGTSIRFLPEPGEAGLGCWAAVAAMLWRRRGLAHACKLHADAKHEIMWTSLV